MDRLGSEKIVNEGNPRKVWRKKKLWRLELSWRKRKMPPLVLLESKYISGTSKASACGWVSVPFSVLQSTPLLQSWEEVRKLKILLRIIFKFREFLVWLEFWTGDVTVNEFCDNPAVNTENNGVCDIRQRNIYMGVYGGLGVFQSESNFYLNIKFCPILFKIGFAIYFLDRVKPYPKMINFKFLKWSI